MDNNSFGYLCKVNDRVMGKTSTVEISCVEVKTSREDRSKDVVTRYDQKVLQPLTKIDES